MLRRIHLHSWLLAAWLLWGGIVSPAFSSPMAKQPASWSNTPTLSRDIYPAYEFQSTSSYRPIVGQTSYTASGCYTTCDAPRANGPRRAGYWNEDGEWITEDLPIGVVEDPAPIGEPLILLLFALLFVAYKRLRIRTNTPS